MTPKRVVILRQVLHDIFKGILCRLCVIFSRLVQRSRNIISSCFNERSKL